MKFSVGLQIADNRGIHPVMGVLIICLPQQLPKGMSDITCTYNDKRVRINGFDHVDKAAEVLKVKVKRFLMYFIICILFYHNELHFELF